MVQGRESNEFESAHTFCCSEMKNEKYVPLILGHEECEFALESGFAFLYDIISRQLQFITSRTFHYSIVN